MYPNLTPALRRKIRELSKVELKTQDEVIQESITKHANDILNISKIKKQLTLDYLEGRLSFDDLARIVGYDNAKEVKAAQETLVESVEGARKNFRP